LTDLIAIALLATQERSSRAAVALDFDCRATGSNSRVSSGSSFWADLSVLRAAGLVPGVVALIRFGAIPLTSTAELLVVGAKLGGWVVAAVATEVPANGAQSLVVEAGSHLRVVTCLIAKSIVVRDAGVIANAGEASSVNAPSFATQIYAWSLALCISGTGGGPGD